MILGISSYTYGWNVGVEGSMPRVPMSATDLVEQTVKYGLHCLQIGDNLPLHLMPPAGQRELKKTLQAHKIRFEIGARGLTEEALLQYIRLCGFFEAPLLRFVIDGPDFEPEANVVIDTIKKVLPSLKKNNVVLGIENHDRFKALELASIMKAVNDENVGICLDCVNSIGAGEGLEHVAQALVPYTVNLHIKDFSIERLPHKMGFTVTGAPAGKGMLDLDFLMKTLAPYKRCQSAILEQWVVPASTTEETTQKEKTWADEGMRYLKSTRYFKS